MCLTTLEPEHDEPSDDQQEAQQQAAIVSQSDSPLLALPTELLIDILLELHSTQILTVQMVGTHPLHVSSALELLQHCRSASGSKT